MVEINLGQLETDLKPHYFLPYYSALKSGSTPRKLRVPFDISA